MFGSQVLDVVIGLVFIYLLLSIICTAVNETIAALFSLRARNLAKGIANLLADKRIKGLAELFYEHPLIKSLYRGSKKPSYIPSRTFALALLDGIAPVKGESTAVMSEIKEAVNSLPGDSELRRLLLILLQDAEDDLTKFRANIETWFNDAMSRVSGWYKRKAQIITLILAVLITGLTNADTIQIVNSLYNDPALRAAVAAQAQEFSKQQSKDVNPQTSEKTASNAPSLTGEEGGQTSLSITATPRETMIRALSNLRNLGIPLGWEAMPDKEEEWANKIIGLLLTTFAISLGAPFWFDILNRVAKIRSTGTAPVATAKDEKKEKPA
jgi:hypothetical protein